MIRRFPGLLSRSSDNVLIIHAESLDELENVVTHRLPHLSASPKDSVVAPFLSEAITADSRSEAILKSETLFRMAQSLKKFAHTMEAVVLCINQSVSLFESSNSTFPRQLHAQTRTTAALGLPWSNSVNIRLQLSRVHSSEDISNARCLSIVFSPHLENRQCLIAIEEEGCRGIS
ncbi:hypothetical protein BC829DRAFT_380016 [Chytridium lagenaria]|nr:hypothetical protein BC829DRAFT_380016 [Chytridium lagenaria]